MKHKVGIVLYIATLIDYILYKSKKTKKNIFLIFLILFWIKLGPGYKLAVNQISGVTICYCYPTRRR